MHRLSSLVAAAVSAGVILTACASQTAASAQPAHSAAARPAHPAPNDPNWATLFDGSSLDGWTPMFGGVADAWAAKNGELVVAKPGQGGWLRTTKMYRDFELHLEFAVPPNGNSGVGLRCSSTGDPAFTGFELQVYDSHGKAPSRSDAGAVYNAIAPTTQAVKPAGEWNTYHIRLVGDTLNVWLNDVQIQADQKLDQRGIFRADDQPLPLADRLTTGFIALQDHGDSVRYRNIQIKDLSPDRDPGDFQPAFTTLNAANAAEISGWFPKGNGDFSIEDGTLIAANGPGHLFSEQPHTDIELRAHVRVALPPEGVRTGNSGIYVRTIPRPEDPNTWPLGFECQIDQHDKGSTNYTGCVYDRAAAATGKPITRDGAWFDYRIVVKGNRIQTFINGVPMADADVASFTEVPGTGHVAFQTHHPGNRVEFRDVQWRMPK